MTPAQQRARRNAWANRRRKLVAYGRWEPTVQVDPAAAAAHLRWLRETYDLSIEALAEVSQQSTSMIAPLLYPGHNAARRWITPATHDALVSARFDLSLMNPLRRVVARGSRRRLQALALEGHSLSSLARRLCTHVQVLSRLNKADHVQVGLAREIQELYGDLEGTPGDSAYARTHGSKNGWLGRDMWDEDTIDQPEEWDEDPGLVDDVAVERALAWQDVELSSAERDAVIVCAEERGLSAAVIAQLLGVTDRTIQRDRARRRDAQRVA